MTRVSLAAFMLGMAASAACSSDKDSDSNTPTGGSTSASGGSTSASGGSTNTSGGSTSISGGSHNATGGSASTTGGSADTTGGLGSTLGGSGGSTAVETNPNPDCPNGPEPPAGECTTSTGSTSAPVCSYGDVQCACQSRQVSAAWVCDTCPAAVSDGDECSVTGMTCGDCVCAKRWLPGGQQAWTYGCSGSSVGGAGSGGTTGSESTTGGAGGNTGGSSSNTGGSSSNTGGSSSDTGGSSGDTGGSSSDTGGSSSDTGGSSGTITCEETTVSDSPNTLTVTLDAAVTGVPKEIFGVLMEILGNDINGGIYVGRDSSIPNTDGIRNDIIDGFKEAGVGAIEWPGGCAANGYDWKANTNPSNTMGTDLYMEFCEAVGAEPFLVGRPQAQFAASNREWVEYVNDNPDHPEWTLKYFKVGNEVWGCGGDLGEDVATYEDWYNANYAELSPPVNGKKLFLVGATGGIWTVNPNGNNWLTTMVSSGHLADKIDGVEIHDYIYFPDDYPCTGFSDAQYYDVVYRANEGQIGPRIHDIDAILDRVDPDNRIKIIEDEWGDWLKEWKASDTWLQQGTLMDAISAAEQLHVFMEHADRVQMGGLAQAVNVIQSLFLTNSNSGGSDLVKTPTFHVFKMFVPHHTDGARWAPNALSSEKISGNGQDFSVLSAGATLNDAGQVNISLVNVDLTSTRDVTITLENTDDAYSMASAQVITASAKDAYNDFGQAEVVNAQPLASTEYQLCGRKLKVTLPSKSITMLTLDPQ